jgi:hypothetical protein
MQLLFPVSTPQNPQTQEPLHRFLILLSFSVPFTCCCNSQCPKPGGFTTGRGLHIHHGKSLHCGAHDAAACQAYIRCNNIVRSHPSPSQPNHGTFPTQPWDIANDDDTSVACVTHSSSVPTSNNTVDEETYVDKVDSAQKTNQSSIQKYTAEPFSETKLLKILNDAAAPHFMYQDILFWASEAKRNNYSFCPQRLEQFSQGSFFYTSIY